MKLGTKISLGFASLIVIAVGLGGMAVWNMSAVKTTANTLAEQSVPSVEVGNNVERWSLQTMYETRGYAFTEEKQYLDSARKDFEEVKTYLKQAREHAAKYNIASLTKNEEIASAKAAEYEKLFNETVARTEAMAKDKAASLAAADRYMKACDDYIDTQEKTLADLTTKGTPQDTALKAANGKTLEEAVADRYKKIDMVNDIYKSGYEIRVGTWQAIATRDPQLFTDTQKKFDLVNTKLEQLRAITTLKSNLDQVDACRAAAKAYSDAMTSFLLNWQAREELNKQRKGASAAVLEAAQSTAESALKETTTGSTAASASLSTASTIMIIGLGAGTLLGIIMAFFTTRGITRSITRISSTLAAGSEQTSSAAGQVSSSSQSLAQGASEQAAALEETTSALEEMSSMTKKNADTAQQAASLSSEAQKSAAKGNDAMSKMSTAINDIQKSASETAKIIKVIDEIAFQTNLLALNAAVEAARAGEAGKGFAVVAEEVRNLAMRSAEAAKNTSAMIEESVNNAKNGVTIAVEVGKNLEEITTAATKVNNLVGEIAAASKEQAQGIDQVNTAVSQMDKVTQSNAASAEESASAAEELSSQSVQLSDMVGELIALVGSANKTQTNSVGTSKARKPVAPVAPPNKAPASAKRTSARIVPLDDLEHAATREDFAEFSKAT